MSDSRPEVPQRVFVLGAGLSAALSPRMPTTDKLGTEALKALDPSSLRMPASFSDGTFEEWLSRLAEDQPDLDEAENLRYRAAFVQLSEAIADVVEQRQREVWASDVPSLLSLLRFVGTLHWWRSTVVSFNYDTLVEQAVDSHQLWDFSVNHKARPGSVIDHMPPWPSATSRFAEEHAETFKLLKLHGSLDWWWVPGDATGATINRWITPGVDAPTTEGAAQRAREMPGRARLIVPPSALKSSFYANPFTRELWRRAARAIQAAAELYLVGYSLPRTDVVTVGMLRERLSPQVKVIVVNLDPGPVTEQVKRLGVRESNIEQIGTSDAVRILVDRLEGQASRELAQELATVDPVVDTRVAVTWGTMTAAAVIGAEMDGHVLAMNCEQPSNWQNSLTHRTSGGAVMSDQEMKSRVREFKPEGIVARFPDGSQISLIGSSVFSVESFSWRTLGPSVPRERLSKEMATTG